MFTREPDHLTDAPPRRRRFWLLVLGVPLLLVALALVGWMAAGASSLQQAIAVADAQDPNWRLDDLERVRDTPPPGRNAAERVVAVIGLLPRTWETGRPVNAQQPGDLRYYEVLNNLQPQAQLNEQQVTAVRAILQTAGPDALTQARSLIETPRGRHAIKWSPDFFGTLLKCQDNRQVAALLRFDALERAQAGDLAGAVAACHALLHTGCSIGDEPLLISQLVRIAIQAVALQTLERVLAQGEPPADALAALQARLEAEEPAPLLWLGMRGERAGGNLFFEGLRNGTLPAANLSALFGTGRVAGVDALGVLVRLPGFVTTQHAGYLRYINEAAEIARRPPAEWRDAFAAQQTQIPNLPVLVRLLAPAMNKVAEACQRNHAYMRNAIVALAAERFRQQHGRWPATLDELVAAQLLAAAPTDPYDGQLVRLKRTADGLVVYCIGPDGADDGGAIDPQNPVKAGSDLGFRLWDPSARRGPAPPPKPPEPDAGGGSGAS